MRPGDTLWLRRCASSSCTKSTPPWRLANRPARKSKSTPADEAGGTGAKHAAATLALSARLGEDGAVLAAESLAPSVQGKRLSSGPAGTRLWVDGPFAESKELIAGFSLLGLPSKADALSWADRYAAILGQNEVDVRELNEP